MLEKLPGVPVVGIIHIFRYFYCDEDSVVLGRKGNILDKNKINIGVVLLKHMSNFPILIFWNIYLRLIYFIYITRMIS